MDAESWIFGAVMSFVAVVWIHAAGSCGVIESVVADGFVIRTILRTRRRVRWIDVTPPARQFEKFFPRVVVQTRSRYFRRVTSAHTVYLRGHAGEPELVETLRDLVGIEKR